MMRRPPDEREIGEDSVGAIREHCRGTKSSKTHRPAVRVVGSIESLTDAAHRFA